jgi:hypothetical protein
MSRSFAQTSLLAMTLGLAALGSTLTPAAALTHPGDAKIHLPPGAPTAPGAKAPGASLHPGNTKIYLPPAGPKIPTGPAGILLPPGSGKGSTGGIDNICPFNKFKCPPKGNTAGNPPPGPGSTSPIPGGQTYPSGSTGPVVIVAPPPVYQAPHPVYRATAPVYQGPRTVVTATDAPTVATAPCNCLIKQYLEDGSVLFQDLCTKEAAVAAPDQSKAQAVAPIVR